jgi:hypothetical protein
MLKDSSAREDFLGSAIVLLGALTTLVPAAAHGHFKRRGKYAAYVRLRPAVVLADNVLQVRGVGC